MSFEEIPLLIPCAGETLVGVLARPSNQIRLAVVFLVGGDQYRVGSHTQFRRLAVAFAQAGVASLRFDVRGMGDSSGSIIHFSDQGPDIAAALSVLDSALPDLNHIVLMGLCDGASSALLTVQDLLPKITGLCLLNPWVRSEQTLAATQIRHYYLSRLFSAVFWKKFFSGEVRVRQAVIEYLTKLWLSFRNDKGGQIDFQTRMADGWRGFSGPIQLLLCEADMTAQEFKMFTDNDPAWKGLTSRPNVECHFIKEADHTFSSKAWHDEMTKLVLAWMINKELMA